MTPREDEATTTPPHGDPLRGDGTEEGAATRHGVQLDPRGEPDDSPDAGTGVPSTPRPAPRRGQTP